MKKFITLAILGLALAAFGCSGLQTKEGKPVTKETKIKCPKCGAEFTIGEGLNAAEQAR